MAENFCFIVEIQSGSSDHGTAMVFDSVWNNEQLATTYCKQRYKDWDYVINKCYFNNSEAH